MKLLGDILQRLLIYLLWVIVKLETKYLGQNLIGNARFKINKLKKKKKKRWHFVSIEIFQSTLENNSEH